MKYEKYTSKRYTVGIIRYYSAYLSSSHFRDKRRAAQFINELTNNPLMNHISRLTFRERKKWTNCPLERINWKIKKVQDYH